MWCNCPETVIQEEESLLKYICIIMNIVIKNIIKICF